MALVGDAYEYIDKRFYDLTVPTATVETLFEDGRWTEGPCWFDDGGFLIWRGIGRWRVFALTFYRGQVSRRLVSFIGQRERLFHLRILPIEISNNRCTQQERSRSCPENRAF